MYLSKLKYWDIDTWNRKLKSFWFSKEEKYEIKQILTVSTKWWVQSWFKRLQELSFINGIWPSWFTSHMRDFITWLFPYFRSEFHDIWYWIGWGEEDKKMFDKGMLKYSIISIQEKTRDRLDEWSPLIIWYDFFVCVPFKYFVCWLFYFLVRIFWIWSFDYDELDKCMVMLKQMITISFILLIILLWILIF